MEGIAVDVAIIGAGVAGICCAARLVERGLSVALVAETPDVAWQLRPVDVGGNHGMIQHPVCEIGWSGGWWYQLARRLNVPVQFQVSPPLELFLRGTRASKLLRNCASASALVDVFAEIAPIPIDPFRADVERIFSEVIAMDWRDLAKLCDTSLAEWLEQRNAHPVFRGLIYLFTANMLETTPQLAQEHASVWTAFAMLRGCVCGEALMTSVKPDVRTGGCVQQSGVRVRS